MEGFAFSSKQSKVNSENHESSETDADWSDIESDAEDDDGDRSLKIDLKDEEDAETSTPIQQQKNNLKSPNRRASLCGFTAKAGSSKKSKL